MPTVALTFDDGPDPEWTPRVLGKLAAVKARATFFVRGEQFKHCPDAVFDALREAPCDVQAHCFSHSRSHSSMSREEIEADISELVQELVARGFPRPTLWRPPLGEITADTNGVAAALDPPLTVTQWHVGSDDTNGLSAESMCATVMSQLVGSDGTWIRDHTVVLMHDHPGASAARTDARETGRLVAMLAEAIRRAGGELAPHGPIPAWL
jgi:peptidoglycan/xylan/chitin deacetylase (PgdA/CDA1 family)